MKLINLNTWAGKIKEPLENFLKIHSKDTDIFCFQEIFNNYSGNTDNYINDSKANLNILQDIKNILIDFDVYFCPVADNIYGIATFVKKGIKVINTGDILLYENQNYDQNNEVNDHNRKMQWLRIKQNSKEFVVMNLHGHWDNSGKGDTPNRIIQSDKIIDFIKPIKSIPKILVGDFNLNPDTKSIKMIEEYLINLITLNKVKTTRTKLYNGEYKYADYIFVSPDVNVEEFEVLPDLVSDHTALLLQFD